jgi:hypothetical protein
VPPEVSKLIAAVTTLVSALNESAGVVTPGVASAGVDDRVNSKKEKVASAPGLLVRFNEPQANDRAWGSIAKIFAKNFIEATKKPDYGDESTAAVPAIIQQTAVVQEKTQEGFFSKLMKFLLPVLALVGGIGLSIAALFQGPGVLGNTLNLVGKLFATIGQNYITKIGNKLLSLGDDFIKGLSNLAEGGLKLLGIGGTGSLGKMFGGIAAKVGGFLLKAAKFIPFLGAAVSFYFAYQRFQSGDYVGMGLEIASGILNLIPGFGWIASAIVDVINITRDFTTTEEERAAGGTGIFSKLFGGIKEWFKANGMTILKSLPVVGSILYFQEAYNAGFTTPEGIKKTMIAFASILGAGPLMEKAINGLFSLFGEKEGEQLEPAAPSAGGKSFFQIAKEFVIKSINKLPYFLRKPLEWLGIIQSAESESEESWMSQGIDKSKEAGKQVLEKMSEFGSGIKDWFSSGLSRAKETGNQVLEKMSEFSSGVNSWFAEKLTESREKAQKIISNISKVGETILAAAKESINTIKNGINTAIQQLETFLMPVFIEIKEIADRLFGWIKGIFTFIKNKWNGIEDRKPEEPEEGGTPPSPTPEPNPTSASPVPATLTTVINFPEIINIKNDDLKLISSSSLLQVELLRSLVTKLDNISIPAAASTAAPSAPATPTASNGGSLNRGFIGSSLLTQGTIGSIA